MNEPLPMIIIAAQGYSVEWAAGAPGDGRLTFYRFGKEIGHVKNGPGANLMGEIVAEQSTAGRAGIIKGWLMYQLTLDREGSA